MIYNISKQGVSRIIANRLVVFFLICAAFVFGVKWTEFTSKNISSFPIEQGNIRVFPLISRGQAPSEMVIFQIESFQENTRPINRYLLDYWFEPQQASQVGFVFVFNKPLDLSQFSHIRFNCFLNAPSIWIRVFSTPQDMTEVEVNKGTYGLNESTDEQEVSIPFSLFVNTDWRNISVLNFYVDSDTTFKVANKRFAIEKIEFVK